MARLKRWLRRLFFAGVTLTALVAALLVGLWIWISTDAGKAFVKGVIEDQATGALEGGELTVGSLETDFLEGLILEDVDLREPGGRSVIHVDRLAAEFRLRKLISGSLPITSLTIGGPALDVVVDDEGVNDFTRLFGEGEEDTGPSEPWGGLPVKIQLGHFDLSGGRVTWTTPDDRWALEDLALTLAAAGSGREIRIDKLDLDGAITSHGGLPLRLDGGAGFFDGDVEIKTTTLVLGESSVGIAGAVNAVETEPSLGLVLDIDPLETADLEQLLGELGLKGAIDGEIRVHGPLSALSIDSELRFPVGSAALDLELGLTAEPMTWGVALETEGVALDAFVEAITEPINLTGALTLDGSGTAWPDEVQGEGRLSLSNPVVWGYLLMDADTGVAIRDGALWLDGLALDTPWAAIGGGGMIGADGVAMDLDVSLSDLGGLAEFGVNDLYGTARVNGALSVDWSGEAVDTRFRGDFQGGQLVLPGNVLVGNVSGPVNLVIDGGGTNARGVLEAQAIGLGAMFIQELRSPWEVNVDGAGSVTWDLEPWVAGLDIAELPIAKTAEGTMTGGIPGGGDVALELDLDFTSLIPDHYNWGRGGLHATMDGTLVDMELTIEDSEENVFRFTGDMDTESLDVRIRDFEFAPDDVRWRSESAIAVQVVDDGVSLDGLNIRSSAGELEISGRFVTAGELDARVRIGNFDLDWLAHFVPDDMALGVEGLVDLDLSLAGRGSEPDIRGTLGLRGLKVPGAVDKLTGELALAADRDRISISGYLGLPKARILGIDGTLPVKLDLSAPDIDIESPVDLTVLLLPSDSEDIAKLLPAVPLVEGMRASAALALTGTAREPIVDLSWSAQLPVGGDVPALWLDGDVHYEGDAIEVSATGREGGRRLMQIDGTALTELPAVIAWTLEGEGEEPDLAAYDTWVDDMDIRIVPLGLPLRTLTGIAGISVDLDGQLAGGLAVRGSPLDPKLYAGFLITEGRMSKVKFGVPMLSLAPVLGGYQFDAKVTFTEEGREDDPGDMTVNAYVPFDLRGGTVDLDEQLLRDSLLVQISGQGIPLAVASAFDPDVRDAEGTIAISEKRNRVTGSIKAPEPDLEVAITGGAFDYAPVGIRVEQLNLGLQVEADRIRLKRFGLDTLPLTTRTPEQDRGHLEGKGSVTMIPPVFVESEGSWTERAFTTVTGELSADHVWLSSRQDFTIQVSGDMDFGGEWPEVLITGDIGANKAVMALGESFWLGEQTLMLNPDIQVVRADSDYERPPVVDEPAFWESWDIALNLDFPPQSTRLDVAMPMESSYGKVSAALSKVELDSWLEGTLDFGMSRGALSISGEVETRRGQAKVFGKDFDLDNGVIRFGGEAYADPILDIEAVHRTTQYGNITATIRESVSAMDLSFTSSEDWADTDIASILLLGMPTSELSQAQGGAGGGLLTAALAMMTQQAADAGMMGNLDLLEVESSDSGIGGIRAGRALSDKLFLIVGLDFSPEENENTTEATIEWLISRQIFAEFVTGDAGETSADVYTRWRF